MKPSAPDAPSGADDRQVFKRPDGFYWRDAGTGAVFGPFATREEALSDLESSVDAGLEPGESLREAEDEIGIADWIDPETGEPAEEQRPRIEDGEH